MVTTGSTVCLFFLRLCAWTNMCMCFVVCAGARARVCVGVWNINRNSLFKTNISISTCNRYASKYLRLVCVDDRRNFASLEKIIYTSARLRLFIDAVYEISTNANVFGGIALSLITDLDVQRRLTMFTVSHSTASTCAATSGEIYANHRCFLLLISAGKNHNYNVSLAFDHSHTWGQDGAWKHVNEKKTDRIYWKEYFFIVY